VKLAPTDSGKFDSLPLCNLADASEEMRATRDMWQKTTDETSSYNVAVAVEKLLEFLLPISESIELLCLEFFGTGDYKSM
jgi:hypothetical protein